jgi:hypothetical protein
MHNEKIPYLFVPIPRIFFSGEFFFNANTFRFVAWTFNRVAFCQKRYLIDQQYVILERGEFVFGRKSCSREIEISEQSLRTIINHLTNQQLLIKITNKSTNKFSVYRWLWETFSGKTNHQINQQVTSSQPATNHKQEYKNKEKSKLAAAFQTIEKLTLSGDAKIAFLALSQDERENVLKLYKKRGKKSGIQNPEGWILQCIKEGWHKEQTFSLSQQELNKDYLEENKRHAEEFFQNFSWVAKHVIFRQDFLQIEQWQIFYSENPIVFKKQLKMAFLILNKKKEC